MKKIIVNTQMFLFNFLLKIGFIKKEEKVYKKRFLKHLVVFEIITYKSPFSKNEFCNGYLLKKGFTLDDLNKIKDCEYSGLMHLSKEDKEDKFFKHYEKGHYIIVYGKNEKEILNKCRKIIYKLK